MLQRVKNSNRRYLQRPQRSVLIWGLIVIFAIMVFKLWEEQKSRISLPSYPEFYNELVSGKINRATLDGNKIKGVYIDGHKNGSPFTLNVPIHDDQLLNALRTHVKNFRIGQSSAVISNAMMMTLPIVLVIIFAVLMQSQHVRTPLHGAVRFGKIRARRWLNSNDSNITFHSVAGIPEAKEELREIIQFLKKPKQFQKLGGKIPKGALLIGPPGTGKTLLAKAIAGEANVPFFSISGSDFVEMFAGVGASRVRDLFKQASRHAPCIIFLDEIDAVGRFRGTSTASTHDEREQTLNALLVELDGFNTQEGIILLAATNRPDILDPALLRPGRFDRQVILDLPDINGREAILKVHTRRIILDTNVRLDQIARITPGFSGAELANLVNEAALLAARNNQSSVTMKDFEESRDKVTWGRERKSRVMNEADRTIAAYHEAGHALATHFLPDATQLHKVTIIPRGQHMLGSTLHIPASDRQMVTRKQILAEITLLMSGRAAEELAFSDCSTGAHNDIKRATELARLMVCEWGMSANLGPVRYTRSEGNTASVQGCSPDFSEQTAAAIDAEIKDIIADCHTKALNLIARNKETLISLATELLKQEVLDAEKVKELITQSLPAAKG
ncbi:MAG: ATP-dependent metallopeptidase FtsH/Yme1/Tma family protein [Candidatus Auribacter fodinae]|jgi:cell division protease FtsH|uniref:ATP-dependent zinc metalloprotease FtsH n=1 Tax=Candidatus Auribacter fodinae TaxID=2093366 RepID=A0A3A4QXB8_9BACT|nr:MAG: ATP-dependent metallopeptidase FtsH/Yme1/Tma family protein [Candidatus Auribacter fodinae]